MRQAYHSRIITYWNGQLADFDDAYLVVENGKVKEITKEKQIGAIDYSDYVILPGFVDTHTHLPQIDARAKWEPNLLGWLEKYIFPAEARFSDDEYARRKSREFFKELLKNGTTTAAIYAPPFKDATDVAFQEGDNLGIRFIMGQVIMDMNVPEEIRTTVERAKRDVIELAKKWHGWKNRIFYAVTPRFAVSCSMDMMKQLGYIGNIMSLFIQTHVAEQVAEIDKVKELYPTFENYVSVYKHAGLLGDRTILAHGVHLSHEELNILKLTDTRISHCPSSNFFLHSGVMSMIKMKEHKIKVALGSDVAAGPYFSMLEVARDASYSNKISPEDAFYLLTIGGARILNFEHITGSLEPGKSADFVVLKIPEMELTLRELLSNLIYLGKEHSIKATYVEGKLLYESK